MNRPRPVLTKAGIAGAITSVAGVLVFLGYGDAATKLSAEAQGIAGAAIGLFLLVSHILPAISAQKDVTPKHSPQADDGMPLIRADQVVPIPQYVTVTTESIEGRHAADEGAHPDALDGPDADAVLAAADEIHPRPRPLPSWKATR